MNAAAMNSNLKKWSCFDMNTLKRMWLQYLLASDEQYLLACKRDGLSDSLDLAAFEKRIQALRVQIATLTPIRKRVVTQ